MAAMRASFATPAPSPFWPGGGAMSCKSTVPGISRNQFPAPDSCQNFDASTKSQRRRRPNAGLCLISLRSRVASYVLLPAEMNRANPAKTVESSSMSDLPLTIEVHLGQREVTLSEIQALQTGAVLPLDTLVTEELELFVSNVRLAKVEVVVRDGWLSARVV